MSGGDDDLAIGTSVVSLKDPLSGARIRTPAHFLGAAGLVAFDLENFLAMAPRTRKWQCPNSMRHGRVQDVRQDAYLSEVLRSLEAGLDRSPSAHLPSFRLLASHVSDPHFF